jgi:hypothetical protein
VLEPPPEAGNDEGAEKEENAREPSGEVEAENVPEISATIEMDPKACPEEDESPQYVETVGIPLETKEDPGIQENSEQSSPIAGNPIRESPVETGDFERPCEPEPLLSPGNVEPVEPKFEKLSVEILKELKTGKQK